MREKKLAFYYVAMTIVGFAGGIGLLCCFISFITLDDVSGDIYHGVLEGFVKVAIFTMVCATLFVICLWVMITDQSAEIVILKGEKRALLRGKEDVGHALAALHHCIIEGNKNVTALEMRMKVNTIVVGLDLPVGFDTEKLKEWKDKILATVS
jgi:hypothetical protein